MSPAGLRLRTGMPASPKNRKIMWKPLNLEDEDDAQVMADRQAVLNLVREIYDPYLKRCLLKGYDWKMMFVGRYAETEFLGKMRVCFDQLPERVRQAGDRILVAKMILDVLKFHRFSDPSWRVPLGYPVPLANPAPLASSGPLALPVVQFPEVYFPVADSPSPTVTVNSAPAPDTAGLDILADAASRAPRWIPRLPPRITRNSNSHHLGCMCGRCVVSLAPINKF
ncbi:uncharacterized protein N7506_007224 [Penicillium brevicompactum]|uniref:uncharacterized protein n=1 Tax=Penicillium brevicompactum TaxID=5074 RepID=UPI00253FD7DC|nr:uncharacterized protein N7506_007224 [Penicillium brevicompactum]KAJ5333441.1 hypothetical protein N7506_007224 [Penicillium brevicompactum]